MSNTIRVMPNQSMADVIVQACGTLEGGMQMMAVNGKSISDYPVVGDILAVSTPDEAANRDAEALRYLKQNDIIIGTLGDVSLVTVTVVLKPVMQVVPRTSSPPSTTGTYQFSFEAAPGFVNVYPIPHAYYPDMPNVPLNYLTEDRYIAGTAYPDIDLGRDASGIGLPYMDAMNISYDLLWVPWRGFMLVWSNLGAGPKTATFVDVNGNKAYSSPLIVLDNATQAVEEYLIADLVVDIIATTHGTATLRLTRSHHSVGHTDFVTRTMTWLEDATGGAPDPLDPTNPDKTILVLPSGSYTFGVATLYINGATTYPASAFTEVVEIT